MCNHVKLFGITWNYMKRFINYLVYTRSPLCVTCFESDHVKPRPAQPAAGHSVTAWQNQGLTIKCKNKHARLRWFVLDLGLTCAKSHNHVQIQSCNFAIVKSLSEIMKYKYDAIVTTWLRYETKHTWIMQLLQNNRTSEKPAQHLLQFWSFHNKGRTTNWVECHSLAESRIEDKV